MDLILECFGLLEREDYDSFKDFYCHNAHKLSDGDRQNLLVKIIDEIYTTERFFHLKRVFDLIIDSNLGLNFDIDHHAPTFLSLVILRAPSKGIFDYFLRKGANINYVGDSFAHYRVEDIKIELEIGIERHQTCLDFANQMRADMFTCDFRFGPEKESTLGYWVKSNSEEVCLKTEHYVSLLEQSLYLGRLVSLDNLIDHIIDSGGRTFDQLMERKKELLN